MTVLRLLVDSWHEPVARALLDAAQRPLVAPRDWQDPDAVVEVDATEPAGIHTAVQVALRGGSVLARVGPDTLPVAVADLGCLGPVVAWVADAPDRPRVADLTAEHVGALAVLGAGGTTADAAARLHLSQRSVERRLKEARSLLGVGSVAEAVVELSRAVAGWRSASTPRTG